MSNNDELISDKVMQKIKHGDVRMKSRTYFMLLSAAAIVSTLLAGIALAYLTSILFFWVKIQTADTAAYGARRNLSVALSSFPWWALLLAALLLVLAVLLVRKHGTMYRHKPVTVAVAIVLLSVMTGIILASFGIGDLHHSQHSGNKNGSPHIKNSQQYMK